MARFLRGMKIGSTLFALAVAALVAGPAPSPDAATVSIGEGAEVVEFIEAQPLLDQSRQLQIQIVYLADEIGMSGRISSLDLQGRGGTRLAGTKWTIRIKHTDMPGFRKRWVSDRGRWTEVYEDRIQDPPSVGRLRFDFDRTFEYDGLRNLLIDITIEDIPPDGSVPLTCTRPPWARMANRVVGLLPSLPPSGDPRELAGNFRIKRWTPNITFNIEPSGDPAGPSAAFPFHEGFESGTLAGYWDTVKHAYVGDPEANVIEVTPRCGPHEGSFHLRMTAAGSGDALVNAAVLTIDLADQENVVLNFRHKWFDYVRNRQLPCNVGLELPSVSPLNGVAISEDGETWVAVIGIGPTTEAGGAGSYLQYFADLDEAAERAEMMFNPHFRIKFQYGLTHFACLSPSGSGDGCAHPCNLDPGVTLDEIVIDTGNPPPTITGIYPASAGNDGVVSITDLSGTGFIHGAEVRLTRAGQADIVARDCTVFGSGRITCNIPLEGAAVGPWDIVVTNSVDALSGTLPAGFEVMDASIEVIAVDGAEDEVIDRSPMGTGFYCQREQVIYRAGEIGQAGPIIEIALYVDRPPYHDLSEWTIRMKHTNLAAYPEDASWESDGWTVCHHSTLARGQRGWRTIPLAIPFEYDGTRNLMIDFSFNNREKSYHGQCRASLPGETVSIGLGKPYSACPHHPMGWTGSDPGPQQRSTRPYIRLTFVR